MTIFSKICLLFGQYILDGISHKSPYKYHSLHMSSVDSVEKFLFFIINGTMGLFSIQWQPQSAQCLQSNDAPLICFLVLLRVVE